MESLLDIMYEIPSAMILICILRPEERKKKSPVYQEKDKKEVSILDFFSQGIAGGHLIYFC